MSKFLRILSLVFLGLVLLGSLAVVGVRIFYTGEKPNDSDLEMIALFGVTALLALGSFLYHAKRMRRNAKSRKSNETEVLLDDHLIAREVKEQRIPLILRLANILLGIWAAIVCISSLNEMYQPYTNQALQIFLSIILGVFGYLFVYIIVGSLAHFIKHGK